MVKRDHDDYQLYEMLWHLEETLSDAVLMTSKNVQHAELMNAFCDFHEMVQRKRQAIRARLVLCGPAREVPQA